jgi:hypothetical protein
MGNEVSQEDRKPLHTVGSIDLNFHGCLNLEDLKRQHNIEDMHLVSVSISNKSHLLLLFHETLAEPHRIECVVFPASRADTKVVVIIVDIGWSTGSILNTQLINFGTLGPNVNYIDETSQGFILASGRCHYGEKNVVVTTIDGSFVRELCFGDGIAELVCFKDEVTIGYIDEGIYGNYGWNDPIGRPGIVKFDLMGNILWKNTEDSISEIYAMTMNETGKLYFYNYDPFMVVCSSFENGTIRCNPEIDGSRHLSVSKNGEWIMLDGGYGRRDQFYAFCFNQPNEKWQFIPKLDGQQLSGGLISRGSKLVMLTEQSEFSFVEWESQ